MTTLQFPKELNGIPLSTRNQWLLFAPIQFFTRRREIFETLYTMDDTFAKRLMSDSKSLSKVFILSPKG